MSEAPIDLESVTGIEIRDVDLDGQRLRAGIRRARDSTTPLLVFNGIGANLELVQPFVEALEGVEVVVFDVPGVGGSPAPTLPYRFTSLAWLADKLMKRLGYATQVDVLGVSWGGALAQQFAHQFSSRCRRLHRPPRPPSRLEPHPRRPPSRRPARPSCRRPLTGFSASLAPIMRCSCVPAWTGAAAGSIGTGSTATAWRRRTGGWRQRGFGTALGAVGRSGRSRQCFHTQLFAGRSSGVARPEYFHHRIRSGI